MLSSALYWLAVFSPSEDKGALAKLVEAIKTNYNDRYEEVSLIFHQLQHICLNGLHIKQQNLNVSVSSRSVVTGEVASWDPSPQPASTSWRRQRPRSWPPSLVKLFGIKTVCPNLLAVGFYCSNTSDAWKRQVNNLIKLQGSTCSGKIWKAALYLQADDPGCWHSLSSVIVSRHGRVFHSEVTVKDCTGS